MGIQTWWDSRNGGVLPVTAGVESSSVDWDNGAWGAFMSTYARTSFNTSSDPAPTETATYTKTITAPFTGTYTLKAAADNTGSAEFLDFNTNNVLASCSASGFSAALNSVNSCSRDFSRNEKFKIRLTYRNTANDANFTSNPGAGAFLLEGPDVQPTPPLPTITLDASSTNVTVGDGITLTWNTPGFDIANLEYFDWSLGPYSGVVGRSGNASITINSTTTFVYQVFRVDNPLDFNQVQVTVTATQPAADLDLTINDDGTQRTSITIERGELVTLQWTADDYTAGTLSLTDIAGEPDNPGTVQFSPDEPDPTPPGNNTKTYTLSALGLDGVTTYTDSVTVTLVPPTVGPNNPPAGSSPTSSYPPEPDEPDDPTPPGGDPVFPGTGLLDAYGVLRIGLLNTSDAAPDTFQDDGAEDTFSVGRYRTNGWDETTSFVGATFNGNVSFEVGGDSNEGTSKAFLFGIPPHTHYVLGTEASGPSFFATAKSGGTPSGTSFTNDARNAALENDPQPIIEYDRNDDSLRSHSHHLSFGPVSGVARIGNDNKAGNYGGLNDDTPLNPGEGYWNTSDSGGGPFTQEIDLSTTYNIGKKLEKVIDVSNQMGVTPNIGSIVMTNRSRIAFDESLKVYLQSGEGINLIGDYTRTKYIIKAYVANNNVNL